MSTEPSETSCQLSVASSQSTPLPAPSRFCPCSKHAGLVKGIGFARGLWAQFLTAGYEDRHRGLSLRLVAAGHAKDEAAVGRLVTHGWRGGADGLRTGGWVERLGTHGWQGGEEGYVRMDKRQNKKLPVVFQSVIFYPRLLPRHCERVW